MDKSLFWLTQLCARLREDPLPVVLYVGPLGNYLYDPPATVLEILFVTHGTLKAVEAGPLTRDIGASQAAILNQHFGVKAPRSADAETWGLLIDVTREPLFADLANKPLFSVFPVTHHDRLLAAFRNVAAWSSKMAPHSWHLMTRTSDLSLSIASASRRSLPIHKKAALYELFAILMDEVQNRDTAPLVSAPVKAAVDHIIAHYSDSTLTLPTLTRIANLCPSHLWRLFKREIGMSPMRFLRDTRIRQGAALLEQTDLRVGEIAGKVGFEDPLYFSRMFRAVYRCSPLAYRKRMNGKRRTG
jgi:AraC-like DNA-binding protein